MSSKWYQVGKIKDAHSLKGEVYVLIFSGEVSWAPKIKNQDIKLTDINGKRKELLLKVLKFRPHKEGLILTLEGFNDRTQAESLKGYIVHVPDEFFKSDPGENIYLKEVLDFKVYEGEALLGVITGFSFNGAQDLILVQGKDKTHEIPFVEEFITHIDFENNKVTMNLPEGLMSI